MLKVSITPKESKPTLEFNSNEGIYGVSLDQGPAIATALRDAAKAIGEGKTFAAPIMTGIEVKVAELGGTQYASLVDSRFMRRAHYFTPDDAETAAGIVDKSPAVWAWTQTRVPALQK